jgi:hypothetical protein
VCRSGSVVCLAEAVLQDDVGVQSSPAVADWSVVWVKHEALRMSPNLNDCVLCPQR